MAKTRIEQLLNRPGITPEEAREIIPLSRNGIYEAIKRGDIDTIRIGKKIIITTAHLRRKFGIEAA